MHDFPARQGRSILGEANGQLAHSETVFGPLLPSKFEADLKPTPRLASRNTPLTT